MVCPLYLDPKTGEPIEASFNALFAKTRKKIELKGASVTTYASRVSLQLLWDHGQITPTRYREYMPVLYYEDGPFRAQMERKKNLHVALSLEQIKAFVKSAPEQAIKDLTEQVETLQESLDVERKKHRSVGREAFKVYHGMDEEDERQMRGPGKLRRLVASRKFWFPALVFALIMIIVFWAGPYYGLWDAPGIPLAVAKQKVCVEPTKLAFLWPNGTRGWYEGYGDPQEFWYYAGGKEVRCIDPATPPYVPPVTNQTVTP